MSIGSVTSLEDIKFVPARDILISKIKFDERNPNVLSNEKNDALYNTVEKYGFAVDPWLNDIGDGYYLVIDGEHRIKILIEKGVKSVRCKIFKLSYVDVQMLRQVANKLRGEHDKTKDADEFKSIFDNKKLDDFAKMLGEPLESFQEILRKKFDMSFGNEEKEIPEPSAEPKAELGEIYELGNHRIMCGDNQDPKNYIKLLGSKRVSQLNTDPPYGVMYGEKNAYMNKLDGGNRIEKQYENDELDFNYNKMFNVIFTNIPFTDYNTIYIWSGDQKLEELRRTMDECKIKFSQYLIWLKNNHVLNRKDYSSKNEFCLYGWKNHHKFYGGFRTNILEYDKPLANKLHPTQKPPELISQTITDGTQKEDIVLDVFLGSGSTLIACEQTDRICYGMEIDPAYIDIIIERWENFTGKKAILLK